MLPRNVRRLVDASCHSEGTPESEPLNPEPRNLVPKNGRCQRLGNHSLQAMLPCSIESCLHWVSVITENGKLPEYAPRGVERASWEFDAIGDLPGVSNVVPVRFGEGHHP